MISVIDHFAHVKKVRVKSRTEPWINNDILYAIDTSKQLIQEVRNNKENSTLQRQFNTARNYVQKRVREAENNYFANKSREDRQIIKNFGTTLVNQDMSPHAQKLKKLKNCTIREIDGEICHDSVTVGNYINTFFNYHCS